MRRTALALMASAFALGSVMITAPGSAQQAQKTVAACQAEWRANKADNQAKHITEKAYVAQCRGGEPAATTGAAAAPATNSAPATTTKPASNATTAAPAPAPSRAQTTAAPTGANQFASEGQAKSRCPSDTVVWVNLPSHIYHFAGTKNYGNTKQGAYMCEKDATASGNRASKAEKHPS